MKDRRCSIEGCNRPHKGLGYCGTHYWRLMTYGEPMGDKPVSDKRLGQSRGPLCAVDDCGRSHYAKGYCLKHYQRFTKHGDPKIHMYAEHGTGSVDDLGYRRISVSGVGGIREHRHVMEQHLGRPLLPEETVHHLNGQRADNRLENLELWSSRNPKGQRIPDKVAFAIELLELYAPGALSREPYQLRL